MYAWGGGTGRRSLHLPPTHTATMLLGHQASLASGSTEPATLPPRTTEKENT